MFKQKNIKTGTVYYSDLIPELEHFFTTRETVLRSNEGIDDIVNNNIGAVCDYLNIEKKNLISPTQTHSSNVEFAKLEVNLYPETDSLVLDNFEQAIYLNFADCVPVILYDKKNNVAAIAHAGWRGTVSQIVQKTVFEMINKRGTKVEDVYAVIGPAIGMCCYNVGNEVEDGVKKSVKDYSKLFRYSEDKIFVDLKQTNAQQLFDIGVLKEHIDICPFCTSCRNDLFFSYRKENGTTSRHSAVIKLLMT
ncbi:MAG: peptidoglycan editing factor PgeF [Candidatus Gastranaerophilales bacterium]|nr:peptidoglycan editing factor PgeF [Candidatus Gastranaerophilales bacterium]